MATALAIPNFVHSEMVAFVSGQGLSVFSIPPEAGLGRSIPRMAKKRIRSPGLKDADSGWTQIWVLDNLSRTVINTAFI